MTRAAEGAPERDTLWFSSAEDAELFTAALAAAGHSSESVFDDDFEFETAWRHGATYTAEGVTDFSVTSYSAAGPKASRFHSA